MLPGRNFGIGERANEMLDEIRLGTPFGRTLGNGAGINRRVFNVEHVPVVKNQVISAYDPRSIKGTGVTYATSPQGADHTAGLTIRYKVNYLDPEVQAKTSASLKLIWLVMIPWGPVFSPLMALVLRQRRFLNYLMPVMVGAGSDILQKLGRETLRMEREFNKRAGFTSAHDRLPEWMASEPLAPNNSIFDVSEADLDGIFDFEK
jgi:aldehyde:ferredoxin oxidoreductase